VAVSILAETSLRIFERGLVHLGQEIVAHERGDVVGRLRLLVVGEHHEAVDGDVGLRGAELGDVDRLVERAPGPSACRTPRAG
jgi:hypothetical protein